MGWTLHWVLLCCLIGAGADYPGKAAPSIDMATFARQLEENWNDGRYTLFEAAEAGDTAVLRALLEENGSPNYAMPYGGSLLYYAVRGAQPDAARMLLEAGADPLAKHQTLADETPVSLVEHQIAASAAPASQALTTIQSLLRDAITRQAAAAEQAQALLAKPWDPVAADALKDSPYLPAQSIRALLLAAMKARDFEFFASRMRSNKGTTLRPEAYRPALAGLTEAEQASWIDLLRRADNQQAYLFYKHALQGRTPSHGEAGAENGNAKTGIDTKDETEGRTMLMHAAAAGNVGVCRLLIEDGANPGLQDHEGKTAQDLACSDWCGTEERAALTALFTDFESRTTAKQ